MTGIVQFVFILPFFFFLLEDPGLQEALAQYYDATERTCFIRECFAMSYYLN